MTDRNAPNVGTRIRRLRERRKLTIRQLAERSHLSLNAISLIERGENSPTVSSLHLLATALGVNITDFFEDSHDQSVVCIRRDQRYSTQGNGLLIESLGFGLRNQQLEPFLLTMAPEIRSANDPIVHPGQEFVFCLEGKIECCVGDESYQLDPGDSLLFDATLPHSFHNNSAFPTKALKIFQAYEGNDLARRLHLEI